MDRDLEDLAAMLWDMDVPSSRRELKPEDLLWLSRNLGINNRDHRHFHKAQRMIADLLKQSA